MKHTKKTGNVGAWVRAILQILAYVNQLMILIGQSPLGNNPIYVWISFIVTVLITVLSYWYNNDWTSLAKTVGMIFEMVKDGKITEDELREFMEDHLVDKEDDGEK